MAGPDPLKSMIEKELRFWPDVAFEIKARKGKHREAVFSLDDNSRFVILPSTAGDTIRGPKNMMRDVKKVLKEIGAKRRSIVPVSKRDEQKIEEAEETMASGAVAKLAMNEDNVILSIPKGSPLMDRFVGKDGKAAGHWAFEMRANPDLKGEPFFTVVAVELPKGTKRQKGVAAGFANKAIGGFSISITAATVPPVVKKFGPFSSAPIEVYQDLGKAILFKLPEVRKPPILRGSKRVAAEKAAMEEDTNGVVETALAKIDGPPLTPEAETLTERLPHTDAVAHPAHRRSDDPTRFTLNPVTVPLSIERAVNFLNSQKEKKGSDLRFTIIEGGFLSVVAHFGKRG